MKLLNNGILISFAFVFLSFPVFPAEQSNRDIDCTDDILITKPKKAVPAKENTSGTSGWRQAESF